MGEELLKIRADQKHKIHVLTVSKQQVCDKKRRLQAPTPPPAKPDVKPAPIDIEYNCKSVEYSLKKRQFALDDVIQELKKKKCDIPKEPKKTCEEKCKADLAELPKNVELLKKYEEIKNKACAAKDARNLQAPAPAPTPEKDAKDTADEAEKPKPADECEKATKSYSWVKWLMDIFETTAKACSCDEDKPLPPVEPPTCEEILEENNNDLKERAEVFKKMTAEFEKECGPKKDKRRLQSPTPAPVKPDVCADKKTALAAYKKDTEALEIARKALPCYEPTPPPPPVEKKTCEELLKIRADQKHKIHVLTVSKQQVCDKKRRLQAPTPPPAKPDVKPAPIDIEYNCKSVEYSLKKRQFALDDVIQELKKKK